MGSRISQMVDLEGKLHREKNHTDVCNIQTDVNKSYEPENKPFGSSFPVKSKRRQLSSDCYRVVTSNNSAYQINPVTLPRLKVQGSAVDKLTKTFANEPKCLSITHNNSDDIKFGKNPLVNFPFNGNMLSIGRSSSTGAQRSTIKGHELFSRYPVGYSKYARDVLEVQNRHNADYGHSSRRPGSCPKRELEITKQFMRCTTPNQVKAKLGNASVFGGEKTKTNSKLPQIYSQTNRKKANYNENYEQLREDIYWYSKSVRKSPRFSSQDSRQLLIRKGSCVTSDEDSNSSSIHSKQHNTEGITKKRGSKRKHMSNISTEDLNSLRNLLKKLELVEKKMECCHPYPQMKTIRRRKRKKEDIQQEEESEVDVTQP